MTTDEIDARLATMTVTELRDLLGVIDMGVAALTAAEKQGLHATADLIGDEDGASITLSLEGGQP